MADDTPYLGRLAFVDRINETGTALDSLSDGAAQSVVLLIRGPSGSGKTTFVKNLLQRIYERKPEALILMQGAQGDELAASRLFENLIQNLWYSKRWHWADSVNVPHDVALHATTKRASKRDRIIQILYGSLRSAASLIPVVGHVIMDAMPKSVGEFTSSRDDASFIFFSNLRKLAKKIECYIAVDNIQYLSAQDRGALVQLGSALPPKARLILIERSDVSQPSIREALVGETRPPVTIDLDYFDLDGIRALLKENVNLHEADLDRLARDCHLKTRGNLKEVEFYVRSLIRRGGRIERLSELRPLLETVELLPRVSRSILTIACLFPAGIRLPYLRSVLSKLSVGIQQSELDTILTELSAIGYLIVNSSRGDLVRASHDKVIATVRKIAEQEEIEDFRTEIIATFKEHVSTKLSEDDLEYILHCLIGILSIGELSENLDYLSQLIRLEWVRGNFSYIVALERNIDTPTVFGFLPDHSLRCVLDAYQKASQFTAGIALIESLWAAGVANRELLDIFRAKFLVQLNRNNHALEALDRIRRTPETDVIRTNVLQILCRDDDAKAIVEEVKTRRQKSTEDYIVLRNSAHLFSAETAEENLQLSLRFFRQARMAYHEATVLNNLAVLWAWKGELVKARRAIEEALDRYRAIGALDQCLALINLAVIDSAENRYASALEKLAEARYYTARTTRISDLNLEGNLLIVQVLTQSIDLAHALDAYETLYRDDVCLLDDEWTKTQFRANLQSLQKIVRGDSEFEDGIWLHPLIQRTSVSGVEIFRRLERPEGVYPFVLVLTPLWRY